MSKDLKKTLTLLLVLVCIAALAFLCGCGGGEDSGGNGSPGGNGDANAEAEEDGQGERDDGEREITVEEPHEEGESGKVTIEGEDGEQATIEVQEEAPSEESLGAPIYPGSEYVDGSGVSGTTSSGDKQLSVSGAEFTTDDDISKVVSWYKERLGEPMSTSAEVTSWMFTGQGGAVTTVIAELFEGSTKITIAKVSGDIDINL